MKSCKPKIAGTLVLILSQLLTTLGYPNGAPQSTCATLLPIHPGGVLQTSHPPYQVLPSAGQRRVRVILGSPNGNAYQGFMILARDAETGKYVGEFKNLPEQAKHLECSDGVKNAVTHSDTAEKHNLEFDWEAPEDYEGTIIFNSTFAQDWATYWVGVESPRINVFKRSIEIQSSPSPLTTQRITTSPYYKNIATTKAPEREKPVYRGCGDTKNCFGFPDGCVDRKNCQAVASVLVEGERYIFELQSAGAKYVALGLSDDTKMGDDSVVECVNNDGQVSLHMSWNSGKKNYRMTGDVSAVELISSSVEDGMLTCKFTRDKLTVIENRTFDLVSKPYHLLLAAGSKLKPNGVDFHDIAYSSSGQKAFLSDVVGVKAASDVLIRVHGALMLASWIGTASIGLILAKYYRQTWVRSQCCGKDLWFAWHRFFMLLTWVMTLAGSGVIVYEIAGWSSATYHASLGVATTVLCFVQPFMAAIRPHPGASKRPLFNWTHWFVGNAAHICGILAIFFAVKLNKAKLPDWTMWILVGYVGFYIVTHIFLRFAGFISDRQDNQRVNSYPLKDFHSRNPMSHASPMENIKRDAPLSGFRKFMFFIYFITIVGVTTVLVLMVALAPIHESWNMLAETIVNYR